MKQKTFKNIILTLGSLFVLLCDVYAEKEILFKAMQDEMDRSLSELQYKDYEKPFFIAYELNDRYYHVASAQLGAINTSYSNHYRSASVRLMVGDYQMTDENWSNYATKVSHNDGTFPLPLEDDYLSIRRALWMVTNNSYKVAAEKYKNKTTAMLQKQMTKDDLIAPDFSKETPVQMDLTSTHNGIPADALDQLVKNVSNTFNAYPEMIDSDVSISCQNSVRYFLNSEGSKLAIPVQFIILRISATTLTAENKPLSERLEYYAQNLEDLVAEDLIIADCHVLAKNILQKANAPIYQDTYLGPVLFSGQTVPFMFIQPLFRAGNGLISERKKLINQKGTGVQQQPGQTWEQRLGRKVIDRELSIYSKATLDSFDGTKLIGSYTVDMEGVVPPDSLCLIKDGLLVTQLNNRIPTATLPHSNGHQRVSIHGESFGDKIGPDVIFVNSSDAKSMDQMNADLLAIAQEEDLDYIFTVSTLNTHANNAPENYYKTDLKTNTKELVRSVKFEKSGREILRVKSISNDKIVHNVLFSGTPTSVICPSTFLFEEVVFSGAEKVIHDKKPIVQNPLTLK